MKSVNALIACCDLAGYAKFAKSRSDEEVFRFLADYYEYVGDAIGPVGGHVIKFMGDASLMFFPEAAVDAGVLALLALWKNGEDYLANNGMFGGHHLRVHFGTVVSGAVGTRDEKRTDILGTEVNTLFLLKSTGFTLTTEAFRKLAPETRKHFKKHTPPVTYIPLEQTHRN